MKSDPFTDELGLKMAAPEVSESEIQSLATWLEGKEWCTARQIEEALGLDERKVRAIAEHSDGLILSGPGCPGYRLFDGATRIGDADRAAHPSFRKVTYGCTWLFSRFASR
ncbi:MAG TPA: hypothetical protein VL357_03225 [Rariglobus sp.]|jgi:hypothetical protein|nr:hypothetical protein [Rariglobus sp.]